MSKTYNLLPSEILDKLYNKHLGCTESELSKVESRLGIKLPELLKNYYLKYSKLELSKSLDSIIDINKIEFSFHILDEEKDEWEEEYEISIEELKSETQNFLLFWSENQGIWDAGILYEDLDKDNPPVYMTDGNILEWNKASENLNSFILSMLWSNSCDCKDFSFEESNDEKEILEFIKKYNIDVNFLVPSYNKNTTICCDDDLKKMFMFINKNNGSKFTEMRILSIK